MASRLFFRVSGNLGNPVKFTKYKNVNDVVRLRCAYPHLQYPHGQPFRPISLSVRMNDLMEFFDEPKNWGEMTVKVGRAWRKDELRIKSNTDLHKLWYVLLKERNMLLTMDHASKAECEIFPNPERLDKVEESMENLEDVVRERNKAYYQLETAETGEAPSVDLITAHGKLLNREIKEYAIPKHMNEEWQKEQIEITPKEISEFHRKWREIQFRDKHKERNLQASKVKILLRKFPDCDLEALQEQYPLADVEKIRSRIS